MKIVVNGSPEALPADWRLHVALEGRHTRITVERDGKFMPLGEALALRDVLTASSRPALRAPLP